MRNFNNFIREVWRIGHLNRIIIIMSVIQRKRFENKYNNYLDDLYDKYGGLPANHAEAIRLRMDFFNKYILSRDCCDYNTNTEKDWAYVARKEYWYDVVVRSAADASVIGMLSCMARMFMVKRFVCWPFLPIFTFAYLYHA
jgi:hypothetical protein